MGPSGRQVPERASGITVGRHEVRLGVLRGVAARRAIDSRNEKTGRWSARPMGRRGARRRLSRMHAGNPPQRECADDNVEHGNRPFAVVEKRDGTLRNIPIPVTARPGSLAAITVATRTFTRVDKRCYVRSTYVKITSAIENYNSIALNCFLVCFNYHNTYTRYYYYIRYNIASILYFIICVGYGFHYRTYFLI